MRLGVKTGHVISNGQTVDEAVRVNLALARPNAAGLATLGNPDLTVIIRVRGERERVDKLITGAI